MRGHPSSTAQGKSVVKALRSEDDDESDHHGAHVGRKKEVTIGRGILVRPLYTMEVRDTDRTVLSLQCTLPPRAFAARRLSGNFDVVFISLATLP